MKLEEILALLKSMKNEKNRKGMARFGINPKYALGISIPILRKIAKTIGKNHSLSKKLWKVKFHEAKILACYIAKPAKTTEKQMDTWVKDFDSWDLCDQVCANLFDKTPYAFDKAMEWSRSNPEFEKRAGFALMACLAWHNKSADDSKFFPFLERIEEEAADERNYVIKGISWALRQIGKRNIGLKFKAVATARRIAKQDTKASRWIASGALKELLKE